MPAVPVLSGKEVIRVFTRFGWQVSRQRGSHIVLIKRRRVRLIICSRS